MSAHNAFAFGFVLKKVVHFGSGSIKCADDESVIGHVHNQILTHHGQSNESDISPNQPWCVNKWMN